jgi:hypothetical protein
MKICNWEASPNTAIRADALRYTLGECTERNTIAHAALAEGSSARSATRAGNAFGHDAAAELGWRARLGGSAVGRRPNLTRLEATQPDPAEARKDPPRPSTVKEAPGGYDRP